MFLQVGQTFSIGAPHSVQNFPRIVKIPQASQETCAGGCLGGAGASVGVIAGAAADAGVSFTFPLIADSAMDFFCASVGLNKEGRVLILGNLVVENR